jgi:hypothetical protein
VKRSEAAFGQAVEAGGVGVEPRHHADAQRRAEQAGGGGAAKLRGEEGFDFADPVARSSATSSERERARDMAGAEGGAGAPLCGNGTFDINQASRSGA